MHAASLPITQRVLDVLLRHAEAGFPNEVFGVLGQDERGVVVAAEPVEPTSAAPARAELSRASIEAGERRLAERGLRIAGHYHSHPRGRAAPSESDRLQMEPDRLLVLIGFRGHPDHRIRCWRRRPASKFPEELSIEVVV